MSRYAGKDLYVAFAGRDLSGDFRTLDDSEGITIIDASAGDDAHKEKLTGQKDGTVTLDMLGQTGAAGTVIWAALAPGAIGALEWGPEGTVSGKPRRYVTAIVESRSQAHPYEDVVEIQAAFSFKGVVVSALYQACGTMLDFSRPCNSAHLAAI